MYVFSALFFSSLLSLFFCRDNNQVCESTLSPVEDSRCQEYTKKDYHDLGDLFKGHLGGCRSTWL